MEGSDHVGDTDGKEDAVAVSGLDVGRHGDGHAAIGARGEGAHGVGDVVTGGADAVGGAAVLGGEGVAGAEGHESRDVGLDVCGGDLGQDGLEL